MEAAPTFSSQKLKTISDTLTNGQTNRQTNSRLNDLQYINTNAKEKGSKQY